MKWVSLVLPLAIVVLMFSFSRESATPGNSSHNDMAAAANRFLDLLTSEQKNKAIISFESDERFNWHYFPKNDRKGIPLKEMNTSQRDAAMNLLKSALSAEGYRKTKAVIELEAILRQMENRGADDDVRDPGKYYFSIFGEPSEKSIWGWRLEGHHLSLNFSSANNTLVSGTPGFLGSNPAVVPSGPEQGKQILKEETVKAFELLHALDKNQLQKAVISESVPGDIITFVSRKATIKKQQGISFDELYKEQQEKLAAENRKKEEEEKKRKEKLEEQRLAKQRQENLDRMRNMAGGSSTTATGTAAQSSGPSAGWAGRVRARVKPNIVFTDDVAGNPEAIVRVRLAPDGTIVSKSLVKSSGTKAWDDAVLRALDKTEVLPRDVDGRVPPGGDLVFRPKD